VAGKATHFHRERGVAHLRANLGVLLIAAAMAAAPAGASAQGVHVFGGLSLAKLTGDDITDLDRRSGAAVGALVELPLGMDGLLWLTPGVAYVQKGFKDPGTTLDHVAIDYVEVPVLLKFALSSGESIGVDLYAGGEVGFQVKCEFRTTAGASNTCERDATPSFDISKSVDFGGVVGAGLSYPLSSGASLRATALWDMGLSKIDESAAKNDVKNEAILLTVGIAFGLGGR
jgi:hypothetical protein